MKLKKRLKTILAETMAALLCATMVDITAFAHEDDGTIENNVIVSEETEAADEAEAQDSCDVSEYLETTEQAGEEEEQESINLGELSDDKEEEAPEKDESNEEIRKLEDMPIVSNQPMVYGVGGTTISSGYFGSYTKYTLTSSGELHISAINGYTNIKLSVSKSNISKYADSIISIYFDNEGFYSISSSFNDLPNLQSVVLPKKLSECMNCFNDCSKLNKIVISGDSTNITYGCFSNCNIKTAGPIGGGYDLEFAAVHSIKDDFFNGCNSLQSVVLPNTIETIGNRAFYGCTNIQMINIPSSVEKIGQSAFERCENLSKVIIPESVLSVGESAFKSSGLKTAGPIGGEYNIEFGWKIKIPDNAFKGCDSLCNVTIPEGITTLGKYSFSGCTALEELIIPPKVTTLDDYVFDRDTELRKVSIPSTVSSISQYAFNRCDVNKLVLHVMTGSYAESFAKAQVYLYESETEVIHEIELKRSMLILSVGEQFILSESSPVFVWKSSDESVVSVHDGVIIAVGEGAAIVTVSNDLDESQSCQVAVYERDSSIKRANVTLGSCEYSGEKVYPLMSIEIDGISLVRDVDYYCTYDNNINVGMADIVINGMGMYSDAITMQYKINSRNISMTQYKLDKTTFAYTGNEHRPNLTITDYGRNLIADSDYIVEGYYSNITPGTAFIRVRGINNYCGTIDIEYNIENAPIIPSEVSIAADYYDSKIYYDAIVPISINIGDKICVYRSSSATLYYSCSGTYYCYKVKENSYIDTATWSAGTRSLYITYYYDDVSISGGGYVSNGIISKTIQYNITVNDVISVPRIEVSSIIANEPIYDGDKVYLSAKIEPQGADISSEYWDSDNYSVMSVKNGVVTIKNSGKATITYRVNGIKEIHWIIDIAAKPEVEYCSVSLADGCIAMNFYINNLSYDIINTGKVKIGNNIYSFEDKQKDGTYKFSYNVAAKDMDKKICVEVYDGRGNFIPLNNMSAVDGVFACSVRDYLRILERNNDEIGQLAMALDMYGQWSQIYFEESVELINNIRKPADINIEKENYRIIDDKSIYMGSSLILDSKIILRHYFVLDDEYKVVINNQQRELQYVGNNIYYYDVYENDQLDFSFKQNVKLVSSDLLIVFEIDYSILDYCSYAKDMGNETLYNLVSAIYWYGLAMKQYRSTL